MKKAGKLAILLMCLTIVRPLSAGEDQAAFRRGPVEHEKLVDGVYEASHKRGPNKAVVKVTIEAKRIVEIEIVKHGAWKGKKAEPVVPKRIIENQSTDVDVVTGATNSSRVIMIAVQKAIEKAYEN